MNDLEFTYRGMPLAAENYVVPYVLIDQVMTQMAEEQRLWMDRRMLDILGRGPSWAEREREAVKAAHPRYYPRRLRRAIRWRVMLAYGRVTHAYDAILGRPCIYSGDDW